MERFFSWQYWIDAVPGQPDLLFWRVIISVSLAAIVFGLYGWWLRRDKKDKLKRKLGAKIAAWGITVGLIFLLISWLRFENVYFLSMRLWYALWLIWSLVWLVRLLKYWRIDFPKKLAERRKKEEFRKYIPLW